MKKTVKLLSLLMVICMLLSSCGQVANEVVDAIKDNASENQILDAGTVPPTANGNQSENLSTGVEGGTPEKSTYKEGVVLVKYDGEMNDTVLSQFAVKSAEALYAGSNWYSLTLNEGEDTAETVTYLRELGCFEKVDYDYIMGVTADMASVDVSSNPNAAGQTNLGVHNIPNGWTQNGKYPGGSPDVIVAVIDTGVDYNHLDLRNNIWVNPAEIPDNGKDDDGNGYIDDIYGWNCVGDNNDPMDDNGHGTHVAGIIAAENNKIGGVGVAFGCKVMVLKAGNSSGYFNNSDIAEAVQYAYMNGASVINMSFGGSNISIAVEEALENAYNTSILVAAAGNDGACNNLACKECDNVGVSYPAALPYVIGVMSTNANGTVVSSFSNYDHDPYNSVEYEVYAVGEAVNSTWPNNKYASLNGTSMAAPTVAGIAALLRSRYADREVYSTKFIQSQIVNTGKVNPYNAVLEQIDDKHSVANVVEALTKLPKPAVNLYDYYIDDSTSISNKNNGNGVIDAGETVRLYISLHNRGGVASNVNVSIDTYRSEIGDETMTDPYFTFVNNTIQLSDIGTYSVRESGDKYFEIIVDGDCPNDYLVDFNIRFTYENGLDTEDKTVYEDDGKQKAQFNISKGYLLPATIDKDTVYKADKLYIVGEDVVIPEGVTVTFEEGCEIQFYDDRNYYNSPKIKVYGTLSFDGSKEKMVQIYPSTLYSNFICSISVQQNGVVKMEYTSYINLNLSDANYHYHTQNISNTSISNSQLIVQPNNMGNLVEYMNGTRVVAYPYIEVGKITNSYVNVGNRLSGGIFDSNYFVLDGNSVTITCQSKENAYPYTNKGIFSNNIVLCDFSKGGESQTIDRTIRFGTKDSGGCAEVKNNMFIRANGSNVRALATISFDPKATIESNSFDALYQQYATQLISGYYDASGIPQFDIYSSCTNITNLWSHVVSVEMFDKDGNPITTVGREEIKVRVTFNRPMDVNAGTFLTFGTIEPYGDYRIDGKYISDTVWEGTYTLKAQIENGQNFLKVNNAWAAEDPTKTVFGEYHLHEFTIDTTAAMSMNLIANPLDNGIELNFAQDDYDTLLGYNVYRSTEKDGNFVKLNRTIILPDELTFLDENAEPGKTYWYTYTVVLSDFTESNPAGKVQATAKDTLSPNMYHTPINQGYENNNLVISCTASDNVAIATVTLYYRAVGATEWKSLNMAKQSDKYSATIFGSDVILAGLEYYIVASDGYNTIAKGSADAPYTVIVKDASAISRMGDVDGNGVVTAKDALMLIQCLEGKLILSDDEFKRADLNGDGVLSAAEALRILQYVNGKVNTLEM